MSGRILVVDDEENIRGLFAAELESEGWEVECASDSREALDKVTSGDVSLVILDIRLGEEDGLQLLERIKENQSNLPVILSSAYSVYKSDFKSWLADDYVVKSSDLTELKKKIRELVEF